MLMMWRIDRERTTFAALLSLEDFKGLWGVAWGNDTVGNLAADDLCSWDLDFVNIELVLRTLEL